MIDTHTHLYLPEFDDDNCGVDTVRRAIDAGVTHLIFPNVDLSTIAPMKGLASQYPGNISMAMGLHPTEVNDKWEEILGIVFEELAKDKYVAIGEIGIDLYWDSTYRKEQMKAFDAQVARAAAINLPIIIHCRDGLDEALEVLSGHPSVKGVFHSFGGTIEDVRRIRSVGDFYFGINGVVTFKNCRVKEALDEIGLERLLLETDAPYLAPVPKRGKRNESAYLLYTAQFVADSMGKSLQDIETATDLNAYKLFELPKQLK